MDTIPVTISDVYDEYLETLENLPSEIQQNMGELRAMDDDYQRLLYKYSRLKKSYNKRARQGADLFSTSQIQNRLQVEKEYKNAMKKQDQKIDLAMRMHDLLSRHIERIDEQAEKHGFSLVSVEQENTALIEESTPISVTRKRSRSPQSSPTRKRPGDSAIILVGEIDPNEPLYCFCNQISFGDMVACDGLNCEKEWFHYACVGLVEPPEGKWFCADCLAEGRGRGC